MSSDLTIRTTQDSLVDIRLDKDQYPRLQSYPKTNAVFEMKKIVTGAMMYRGQAIDTKNVRFIAEALVDELMQEDTYGAKYITFEEIGRAVKAAVLSDKEMYGVTVASLYKVILAYLKTTGHEADVMAGKIRKARLDAQFKAFVNEQAKPFEELMESTAKQIAEKH